VERTNELNGLLIKRYCTNMACPSYGRKRPGQGRYLGETGIGDPADLLCPDCGETTEIRPLRLKLGA
jgi:hypothetical protein